MAKPLVLECFLDSKARKGFWTRKVSFPFPPFPGLGVGNHTIKAVTVCNGDLDGAGEIIIEFEPIDNEQFLEGQGWEWHQEG